MEIQVVKDPKQIQEKFKCAGIELTAHNFFQSINFLQFLSLTPGLAPYLLLNKTNSNESNLLLFLFQPKSKISRLFSSRGISYSSPSLFNQVEPYALNIILSKLNAVIKNKTVYYEFRNLEDTQKYKALFIANKFEYKEHLNFKITISSENKVWNNLSDSKKRQITKSLKQGAVIIDNPNLNELKEFYQILKRLYRLKVKKPLPSWEFFYVFWQETKKGKLGKYLLVKYQNKVVAGMMCPIHGKKVIYEWFIAGLDKEYNKQGMYPSVLATWAGIKYAIDNQIETFDFMGAGHPDKPYGVREFKAKFGGELVNYGRYIRINKPLLYFIGKVGLWFYGWVFWGLYRVFRI